MFIVGLPAKMLGSFKMGVFKIVFIVVLVTVLFLPSTTSKTPVPYVSIEHPLDGSTIGLTETVLVVAKGNELSSPTYSISGNGIGELGSFSDCEFGEEEMVCKEDLDFSRFEGQQVRLLVSVRSSEGQLSDSVGLVVSGDGAW